MTVLITKADIEAELLYSLPAAFTTDIVTGIIADADNELILRTGRTTFTGYAARRAKRAELLLAIAAISKSNRDIAILSLSSISSISENGNQLTFAPGALTSYRSESDGIISDLTLPGTRNHSLTFAGTHTNTDPGMFDET